MNIICECGNAHFEIQITHEGYSNPYSGERAKQIYAVCTRCKSGKRIN